MLLSFILLLAACDSDVYFMKTEVIEESSWAFDDPKIFEFDIKDTTQRYDLILTLSHSVDYLYENLYVKIYTTFPTGNTIEDKVSLELADKLDQWEGKCKGNKCKVSILLQENIYFKEAGDYNIKMEQFNRISPLQGIEKLTLKIVAAKSD